MAKPYPTAISCAGGRDYVQIVNLAARLKGVNTADYVREALDKCHGSEIEEAAALLADRESQKNHSLRTVRNE